MNVTPSALWSWDTTGTTPTVTGFYNGSVTKSGVTVQDLKDYVGVPIQTGAGSNVLPVPDSTLLNWIRWAEDSIEVDTGLLLSPTWVAAPPEIRLDAWRAAHIPAGHLMSGGQRMGQDYDIHEAGYDFYYDRFIENGWGYMQLRHKPLRDYSQAIIGEAESDWTALKSMAYIYPLLEEFYVVPSSWYVEDQDYGLIRIVPSENIMMLPLFALQLAVLGPSSSVPGAIHIQYTAGLAPWDYAGRWSFVRNCVLAKAAVRVLSTMQIGINQGATALMSMSDGVRQETRFNPNGPYAGFISQFDAEYRDHLKRIVNMVTSPFIEGL